MVSLRPTSLPLSKAKFALQRKSFLKSSAPTQRNMRVSVRRSGEAMRGEAISAGADGTTETLCSHRDLAFAFAPPPPWRLRGQAVFLLDTKHPVLGLIHYSDSPVGSYDELAGFAFTLRGLKFSGPRVVRMWVNAERALRGGRHGWGFPKQMAQLGWESDGARVTFRAARKEWQQQWRFRAFGLAVPLHLRAWTVQRYRGESVRVPVVVAGSARLAFRGRQWAVLIEDFVLDIGVGDTNP
jgi:hypothetical protein